MRDPDYFYSTQALDLAVWGYEMVDQDRRKAIRILRVAHSVEERFRKQHQHIVNDPYRKAHSALLIFKLKTKAL